MVEISMTSGMWMFTCRPRAEWLTSILQPKASMILQDSVFSAGMRKQLTEAMLQRVTATRLPPGCPQPVPMAWPQALLQGSPEDYANERGSFVRSPAPFSHSQSCFQRLEELRLWKMFWCLLGKAGHRREAFRVGKFIHPPHCVQPLSGGLILNIWQQNFCHYKYFMCNLSRLQEPSSRTLKKKKSFLYEERIWERRALGQQASVWRSEDNLLEPCGFQGRSTGRQAWHNWLDPPSHLRALKHVYFQLPSKTPCSGPGCPLPSSDSRKEKQLRVLKTLQLGEQLKSEPTVYPMEWKCLHWRES